MCAAFTCCLSNCTTDVRADHEILYIEGVVWACNISTSFALYGSVNEFEDQWEVHLPASDGDLLYMTDDQELELYYRYRVEDGNHLLVSTDATKPGLVYVNGAISQIEISEGISFRQVINELKDPPEQPLATLYLRDTLNDDMIRELRSCETSLRGTGIMLEHQIGSEQFSDLVSTCRPGWLACENIPEKWMTEQGLFLEDLELLWISGNILTFTQNVQCCKNLESLIIADWEPGLGELVPLSGLKQLHSLTLAGCSITDLSMIEFPAMLERLHLVECDTLTDISAVSRFPELKSLGLAGSDDLKSLDPLYGLTRLTRISFPENISQKEFASVTGQLNSLETIELINCTDVNDLAVLQDLENLQLMILLPAQKLPSNLELLDQLELIILSSDLFEEAPDQVAMLREKLPLTRIVPGSGLCLGSGWLLLLLPLVYLARMLSRSRSGHV